MRLTGSVFLLLASIWSFGRQPDTLTLYECYEQAMINFPVVKQREFIKDAYLNNIKNIQKVLDEIIQYIERQKTDAFKILRK